MTESLFIPLRMRSSLLASLLCVVAAGCTVYDSDSLHRNSTAGSGGAALTGGASGTGGSSVGSGGSVPGDASAGSGGAGTGGGGAGGVGAQGGAAGTGSAGRSGAGGVGGGGAGGNAGGGGSAGSGGATGTAGAGTAGSGGATGTGGSADGGGGAGASGAGGAGGTSGSGGTGGSMDAGLDSSAPTTARFGVGSFVKSGATGMQTVPHALGQSPKALLLWSTGKTNETASANFVYGFGVSDLATSMSLGVAVRDGVTTSSSSRRIAAKAITLVQAGETTIAEADLASSSAASFTLNWTTNDAQPYVVHYLIIGGPQATAKVVNWTFPSGTGNKSVTGVGFQPEVVFHFNVGAAFTNAAPFSLGNAVFGMGAMDRSGGQWASMISDTSAVSPTLASRAQMTDAAIYAFTDIPAVATTKKGSFVSMDASGFTLNFTTSNANAGQVISLAIGGVKAQVGSFTKSTASAPATQSVSLASFRPEAVLLTSFQSVAQTAAVDESTLRFGVGAADATNACSSAVVSADAVTPSAAAAIDRTSKIFTKMDAANLVTTAEADLASFDAAGFTLNWTKNDAVAAPICFVAFGAP